MITVDLTEVPQSTTYPMKPCPTCGVVGCPFHALDQTLLDWGRKKTRPKGK